LNGIGVTPPNLISTTASGVTSSSALTGGEIIHSGWDAVSACGVCYSTNQNPSLSDPFTQTIVQSGEFSTLLQNLEANTTYYYKAYATNIAGTSYGEQLSFTTALGTLDAPQNLRITLVGMDLQLEWNAVEGANSYRIYHSSDPYAESWGLPYAITAETNWTDVEPAANNFYRIVASSEPME
ncbi:MAG: hypothetical protein PHO32_10595, partial [Candidatus Cloacimonetes bacterium]|nr:hypothetical protein [Candidatus Cloacimonadota bacterium]